MTEETPKYETKVGRPRTELTPEQIREVELLASMLSQEQIADYLEIPFRTFKAILARDETVYASYRKGKAKAIASVAKSVIKQAQAGNMAAAKLYLSTQAGWAEKTQVDHTSSDGSMSPRMLNEEELKKEIERRGLPSALLDE